MTVNLAGTLVAFSTWDLGAGLSPTRATKSQPQTPACFPIHVAGTTQMTISQPQPILTSCRKTTLTTTTPPQVTHATTRTKLQTRSNSHVSFLTWHWIVRLAQSAASAGAPLRRQRRLLCARARSFERRELGADVSTLECVTEVVLQHEEVHLRHQQSYGFGRSTEVRLGTSRPSFTVFFNTLIFPLCFCNI